MLYVLDTFYRCQDAVETGGVDVLIDANRSKPDPKNRIEEIAETAFTAFSLERSAITKADIRNLCAARSLEHKSQANAGLPREMSCCLFQFT